jgi:ankyrin repeat protein
MDLNAKLLDAVEGGRLSECAELLDQGASHDAMDMVGSTALTLAVRLGHGPIRDLLLAGGATVDGIAYGRLSPLMTAAHLGDLESCRVLLGAGAEVNLECDQDDTALSYAASKGHASVCELLLNKGAAIDSCNMFGATALSHAIIAGCQDTVDLLLVRGAAVCSAEVTMAASVGRVDMLDQMLARIALVTDDILSEAFRTAVVEGHEKVCRHLLLRGVCPTADHMREAARVGNASMCELLLELGVGVSAEGAVGKPPLHAACMGGHIDTVRLLLANGADVNQSWEKQGWTPIYEAIRKHGSDNIELCRLLVRGGADTKPVCRNPTEMTPFQYAVYASKVAAVRCLAEECNEDPDQLTIDGVAMEQLAGDCVEVLEVLRSMRSERGATMAIQSAGEFADAAQRSRCLSPL